LKKNAHPLELTVNTHKSVHFFVTYTPDCKRSLSRDAKSTRLSAKKYSAQNFVPIDQSLMPCHPRPKQRASRSTEKLAKKKVACSAFMRSETKITYLAI
jgi:hypothetical protein